jgi:hypothetical protein
MRRLGLDEELVSALSQHEQIALAAIQAYAPLKVNEVYRELITELQMQGLQPIEVTPHMLLARLPTRQLSVQLFWFRSTQRRL